MANIRRFIPKRITRLLYPYGGLRTVIRGPAKGFRIKIAPSMGITYILGLDNYHWKFLDQRICKYNNIFDVGANRGQMALYFGRSKRIDAKLYCFEPVYDLYVDLDINIRLNNIKNAACLNIALAETRGHADFLYSPNHQTQGKLGHVEATYVVSEATSITVPTSTLDSLMNDCLPPPDLLKIDVEGGAESVLVGAGNMLTQRRPDIFVELHGPEEQRAIRNELLTRGYVIEDLKGNRIIDPEAQWASPLWCYCNDLSL